MDKSFNYDFLKLEFNDIYEDLNKLNIVKASGVNPNNGLTPEAIIYFYNTFDKKSIVLGFFGFENISSGVPCSTIFPLSMNIILSPTSFANPIS